MNLILQAIKSLFRGLENRISAKIAELTPRVTRVEKNVATVSSTANKANRTAQKALDTAGQAQTTADDAKETADNVGARLSEVNVSLSKKMNKFSLVLGYDNTLYLRDIPVGEKYRLTKSGYITSNHWESSAMVLVEFSISYNTGSSTITYKPTAALTTSSMFTATGLLRWGPSSEDTRVFLVEMLNQSSTSYIELVRLV